MTLQHDGGTVGTLGLRTVCYSPTRSRWPQSLSCPGPPGRHSGQSPPTWPA